MTNRPLAVDLFSGAGGLGLGFEQAGFDIAAAVDVDPIHAATHKYNFPDCAVIPKSVTDVSGREIRNASGIGTENVAIVLGGPPCQGFSLIGQRMLDDPRNELVREFLRLVVELSPSYFLFENVRGLTLGRHVKFLNELVEEFQGKGYQVRLPWQVLNASHFSAPQDRERLFLIGAKKNLALPGYPKPLTIPRSEEGNLGLLPAGPSCKDALGDLPEAERFEELNDGDAVYTDDWKRPSEYAKELRCLTEASWHYSRRREWDPDLLTASARTNHTQISRRRFSRTKPGKVEPISRFYKLPADGVSNTLRAGTDAARGAFTSPRPIHYERDRCITVREMARLHGFPDWFRFHKTKWHGARQIGNAVPPPLARALASKFVEAMRIAPARPSEILELGDPALLGMDMKAAAAYWGIDIPIAGRDRKSGARKRKQAEIEAELTGAVTRLPHGR